MGDLLSGEVYEDDARWEGRGGSATGMVGSLGDGIYCMMRYVDW